jgi:uncharacterized membrane protein
MEVAIATFAHADRAERAFGDARERDPGAAWLSDAAFVEVHRHGRVVVRGTVAGHYVDIDDEADVIGRDTVVGAIVGAAVGLVLGPLGFAVGLVSGGTVGGVVEASHLPVMDGAMIDAIHDQISEGSSAIVVFADPARVREMADALEKQAHAFTHYRLSGEAEEHLRSAVARAPAVGP